MRLPPHRNQILEQQHLEQVQAQQKQQKQREQAQQQAQFDEQSRQRLQEQIAQAQLLVAGYSEPNQLMLQLMVAKTIAERQNTNQ